METFLLVVSILFNITLGYALRNLYKKNITYESIILDIREKISQSIQNMRRIDSIGAFEADDEVGYTFDSLLQIVNELEEIIDVEEEKEEE